MPAFVPMLLDGTKYVPDFKVANYLAAVGFSPDLSAITYISDLPPVQQHHQHSSGSSRIDDMPVEIPPISTETLSSLRKHLEQAVQQDAKDWEATVNEIVAQKISNRVEVLSSRRSLQLVEFERRSLDMDNVSRQRIEALGHLHTSHENEANMLLFKMNQVRTNYSASIKRLILLSREFTEKTIGPMMGKMDAARSSNTVYQLQRDFEHELMDHTVSLKECLSCSTDAFEHGKAVLIKSKYPGHHAAAWIILRESRLVDADNVAQEMDRWRSAFDAEIEGVQNDTASKVHQMTVEFTAYLEDFDLIERVGRCLTDVRLKLKAEGARAKALHKDILDQVAQCAKSREMPKPTWAQAQKLISSCDQIRSQVADYANYLDCLHPGANAATFRNTGPSSIAEWKATKSICKLSRPPTSRPASSKRVSKVGSQRLSSLATGEGSSSGADTVLVSFDMGTPSKDAGHRASASETQTAGAGSNGDQADADLASSTGRGQGITGGDGSNSRHASRPASGDQRKSQPASRPDSGGGGGGGDAHRKSAAAAGHVGSDGRKTPGSAGSRRSLASGTAQSGSDGAGVGSQGDDHHGAVHTSRDGQVVVGVAQSRNALYESSQNASNGGAERGLKYTDLCTRWRLQVRSHIFELCEVIAWPWLG
ncbi:hypothetical protein BC831DRAFT_303274 [Entophlyctis helioformis]|nr:hypothetical protein BC831DRAFT_303274 [Entophlyctis helioformis]